MATRAGLAARIPLRFSLVAVVVGLVFLGLLVSGAALTAAMKDQLIAREDQALRQAADTWARPKPRNFPEPPRGGPPTRFFQATFLPDGSQLQISNPDFTDKPDLTGIDDLGGDAVTVDSVRKDGPQWRVVQSHSQFGVTFVAVTLTEVNSTLNTLVVLELLIGGGVLTIAGGVGYLVVRRSLRPLEQVEATAEAIAAGDLTRRVPDAPPNTEVGRLAASLNTMLHQVQDSFGQVAASEERARADEERMRRFVGDASHELRTPLTSIRGFAELYRQGASGDIDFLMCHIESEAQRMGLLVEDLLLLARLDARRPLASEPVDLADVAGDVVHAAQAREPGRDIDIEIAGADPAGAVTVRGDRDRLHQVVTNLVSNALRHTPDDAAVRVRIAADDACAQVQVADTGPGMEPGEASRVFERFYRTDSSRSRGSGGAGLGLSIVHGIVDRHGGTVAVDTAPGAGATFTVRLPR
ncbi:histidine kinase OS=Tsukamurella paurometabola (strain ATCC 8368 / DSM / CCUG 35730 / CIP 100753/ JCM 10117 / KCTC 9821 / NBRC 16120 / NCIMB 702349 / NCTC 13040) OX=521096 GN=Tpau_3630 PE=4 SV=1 [Tsukamurella paurometabola]|uniref:histidine kinase n=2 Tax=Tsukamurella paurometabola TaxID=2061 RepID=D5UXX1_TSUPD|nr:integral membrane sensor signal transduction histidine kinase [Tsukamurella paurometabola DSM 20162]SUP38843.1 Probable sensor histidine kinase TcrY [Tsukamurella paurometabola]